MAFKTNRTRIRNHHYILDQAVIVSVRRTHDLDTVMLGSFILAMAMCVEAVSS